MNAQEQQRVDSNIKPFTFGISLKSRSQQPAAEEQLLPEPDAQHGYDLVQPEFRIHRQECTAAAQPDPDMHHKHDQRCAAQPCQPFPFRSECLPARHMHLPVKPPHQQPCRKCPDKELASRFLDDFQSLAADSRRDNQLCDAPEQI